MSNINLKEVDTVWLNEDNTSVAYIDQTQLPNDIIIKEATVLEDMYVAIKDLEVRGAPAIGVFAAISMYVFADGIKAESLNDFLDQYKKASDYLNSSRPTAVNLSWALKCMMLELQDCFRSDFNQADFDIFASNLDEQIAYSQDNRELVCKRLHDKAVSIWQEDIETCKKIGQYGAELIKDGDGLLTHCNAGRLATVRYGTATAPMYIAAEQGKKIAVYCDETRPVLQGARLTSFELSEYGIDTTLQCDNMVSSLMKTGKIQAVFVGCDRVAANGDAANKIGTSQVAIVAKHYGVPFYVCGPLSTIDLNTPCGDDIVIEQRDGKEVSTMWYEKPMATDKVKIYNPAFDVTPSELISGIITEKGIVRAPYKENIAKLFEK